MNIKRLVIAVIVVFLVFQILDFLIHWIILAPAYGDLADVWRQDMMSKMWMMYISSLILSLLFVYIFIKGYEGRGIGEGIRYGIIIGLLLNFVGALNQYVVYPIPFSLALQWFIYGMIEFIVCGVVVALIYKPKTDA
ncbi:MAG: hypothetical protein GY849_01750 [Deltaproteobacteria bacterium]|nr:hypothetical protein [Deltaproteobacteria bacterium]